MTENVALPLHDKSSLTLIVFYSFFREAEFTSQSNPVAIPPNGKRDL